MLRHARSLSAISGLPCWGLVDDTGLVHHAFVYDAATDTAYDARGAIPLPTVATLAAAAAPG